MEGLCLKNHTWLPIKVSRYATDYSSPTRPGLKLRKSLVKFDRFDHKSQVTTMKQMFYKLKLLWF